MKQKGVIHFSLHPMVLSCWHFSEELLVAVVSRSGGSLRWCKHGKRFAARLSNQIALTQAAYWRTLRSFLRPEEWVSYIRLPVNECRNIMAQKCCHVTNGSVVVAIFHNLQGGIQQSLTVNVL